MTTAILPLRVTSYRCPDCGAAYTRSLDGLRAVNLVAMISLIPAADGLFACPCESTLRFGWAAPKAPA